MLYMNDAVTISLLFVYFWYVYKVCKFMLVAWKTFQQCKTYICFWYVLVCEKRYFYAVKLYLRMIYNNEIQLNDLESTNFMILIWFLFASTPSNNVIVVPLCNNSRKTWWCTHMPKARLKILYNESTQRKFVCRLLPWILWQRKTRDIAFRKLQHLSPYLETGHVRVYSLICTKMPFFR